MKKKRLEWKVNLRIKRSRKISVEWEVSLAIFISFALQ